MRRVEDILSFISLRGHTTRQNLFSISKILFILILILILKMVDLTTDYTSVMVETDDGLMWLCRKDIIRQQVLCGHFFLKLRNITKLVIQIVNNVKKIIQNL